MRSCSNSFKQHLLFFVRDAVVVMLSAGEASH